MRNNKNRTLIILLPAILVLLLASCSPGTAPAATSTPAPAQVTAAAETPTTQPTVTALPGKALLVTGSGADSETATAAVQAALTELSTAAGLMLETRPGLQKEEITSDIRVVVSLDASLNMTELAGAAPQTQFIAVSPVDLPGSGNLAVIRKRLEHHAFVAGYISVLLSTDYRAGALLPVDGPLGAVLQDAFANGARYFCGVCAPGYPLNIYYPQVAALPAASDGPAWQAAAAGLYDNQKAEVFYLSAEAARPEVLSYLQGRAQVNKMVLVVGDQPSPDMLKEQWAATVRFDLVPALRLAWADVMGGKGGSVFEADIIAENPNANLLGEGRMRLVKDLIAEMKSGRVHPFSIPRE